MFLVAEVAECVCTQKYLPADTWFYTWFYVNRNLVNSQWRSYYGLKYSTNLPIILVFKVCLFCRQRNPFITSEIPMALVGIHGVSFVSLYFRKDTRISK